MESFKVTALLCLVLMLSACEQIGTGNRGVKTTFGKVDMELGSLGEGLYFYNPLTSKISELDAKILKLEGVANTYTRDVQQANIQYVINFRLNPSMAHIVFQNVGSDWADKLVPQAIDGELKKVIGQYDAVELIAKRREATEKVFSSIAASLKDRNVLVDRFEMTNIEYLKTFEKAVEEKQIAIQRAIEAVNRTKQIQEEAKQKIITAEAEAKSMGIRADALSKNKNLVQYEAVNKWDGRLPQYNLGESVPFLQIK